MPKEILDIILSAVSILVTGLTGFAVTFIVALIKTKIKDQKLAGYLSSITGIVSDSVMSVFQSFVQTLKENDSFDEKAQAEAKQRALSIINSQLTPDLKNFITANYGDMNEWLSNKIEATLYSLKN